MCEDVTRWGSERILREELYQSMVFSLAKRSTCRRLHVGALVETNNRVIGTGYNGSPVGTPHCSEEGCLYDGRHRCRRTVHAEVNAILSAGSNIDPNGSRIWVSHFPCIDCLKLVIASGIKKIRFFNNYVFDFEDKDVLEYYCKLPKTQLEILQVLIKKGGRDDLVVVKFAEPSLLCLLSSPKGPARMSGRTRKKPSTSDVGWRSPWTKRR